MSENERSIVKMPSITKQAKAFNSIDINNPVQGIKTASYVEKQTREAELEQKQEKENIKIEETLVPTGLDIRTAREEGEYR